MGMSILNLTITLKNTVHILKCIKGADLWGNYLNEATFRGEEIQENCQKSAPKLSGCYSPNASHFVFCFFENNLTPLFLFTCADHHLKCIQVVFLPSQATLGENDPSSRSYV